MPSKRTVVAVSLSAVGLAAVCALALLGPASGVLRGYPPIVAPADNPMSSQKVELGRWLFYDRRLSFNNTVACADCHRQEFAFSDPRQRSIGATGESTVRQAMSLTNVAYNSRYTWANDSLKTLEQQALIPLTHREPLEMGVSEDDSGVMDRFRRDRQYPRLFGAAFPDEEDAIHLTNVVKAISSFVRTIVSVNAPFDRFLAGDADALNQSAQRGFKLFRSARLGCARCHDGFNFRMTPGHRTSKKDDSVAYHNTGLYNLQKDGSYPAGDRGLIEVTANPSDMGRYKAPTLRNVAVSAPYMHDGSIARLDEVIEHYAAGGRLIQSGPNAGDGRTNPYKSDLVTGFQVTTQEKRDVFEFLKSLTDQEFLTDRSLSSPFLAAK